MIAALYVDPRGPYANLPGVDAWDEARDARLYDGPWPVVAHPPCGPWGSLRHLDRFGDRSCGLVAVDQVRRWGGVLEHPARSSLYARANLPAPGGFPDEYGGFSVEVCQCDWGHVARKRTWLYVVGGVVPAERPAPLEPTHWVSGGRRRNPKSDGQLVPAGIKVCSPTQRRRTPRLFRDFLLSIARSVPQ